LAWHARQAKALVALHEADVQPINVASTSGPARYLRTSLAM